MELVSFSEHVPVDIVPLFWREEASKSVWKVFLNYPLYKLCIHWLKAGSNILYFKLRAIQKYFVQTLGAES